jgi:hypothetical protein
MANGPALYLASTPLTALLAAAVARAQGVPARLVLIEDYADAARWAQLLGGWRDSPFSQIDRIAGRASEARAASGDTAGVARLARERSKRALRLQALASLAAIDAELRPAQVFVGNDRRPETQYALELAARRNGGPCGVYLDDGLFTYVGDAHARPWARLLIDTPLKKLAWGRWWQGAAQAGTTRWITQAWLAWPALARDQDPARSHHALPRAWCVDRAMARLARAAAVEFLGSGARPRERLVLALPHSRVLGDAAPRLRELVAALAARGIRCAVKYHPREAAGDPAGLQACGASLLPSGLALELLAARMARGATLAGEASTALAAARWLRPDLRVLDLGYSDHAFARRSRAFLAGIGVGPASLETLVP